MSKLRAKYIDLMQGLAATLAEAPDDVVYAFFTLTAKDPSDAWRELHEMGTDSIEFILDMASATLATEMMRRTGVV